MSLHRLLFDATAPADGANVGAFLRMDANGELVTYASISEAGTVTFGFVDGDVTVGTDTIAEVGHGLETGEIVRLTSTGTLPAGLALATDYYVIRVDADSFKLASSLANAEAGTAVDITAAASGGTHTVTEQERVHKAMDVNVANFSAVDVDIRDLVFATDKVDVTGSEVSLDAGTLAALENITVSATDLDIRNLVFATDKVDVTGSEVSLDAGTLAALENITVSATDLDIRDLTHVSDSIKIGDGTDFLAIAADGSIAITDNGTSLTVDAVQLDIDDLNATDDAVAAWLRDGTGNAIGSTAGSLDVNITNAEVSVNLTHDTAVSAASETVTTSSAALVTSVLANRENMWIYNNGNKPIFIGPSGVSIATGFPVFAGSIIEGKFGPAVALHAVAESGSQDIRVLQAS